MAESDGGARATLEWESPRLKSKFANLVVHDGFVYGLDDGVLTCLDPGQRRAALEERPATGTASCCSSASCCWCRPRTASWCWSSPRPTRYRELTRFPALDGKTWNPPALAGALLLVRNDREAAAYELPVE